MEIENIRIFLKKLDNREIEFDKHFYKRAGERPINEGLIRSFLARPQRLEKVEKGREERYKLWFKMSRKYSLVLIIEPRISKGLKVISAWNTNRKWQDKLKR
jgi:hypothetical protein